MSFRSPDAPAPREDGEVSAAVNVAIIAYACDPASGSERGAGWAFAEAASRNHAVWLLTRQKHEAGARRRAAELGLCRLTVVPVDLSPPVQALKTRLGVVYPYYLAWQLRAGRVLRGLHEKVGLDVVHHVTFALDWLPSGGSAVAQEVPLVWGPVGGATRPAPALLRTLSPKQQVKERARTVLTDTGRAVFGDRVARSASLRLANNADVAQRFGGVGPTWVEPHAVVDVGTMHPRVPIVEGSAVRKAVFVGRLLPWKGAHLAVEALARPTAANWSLTIYGEGPERAGIEQLVASHGLADRVRLAGRVSRSDVLRALGDADALLHPAMHDSAPFVVAEAMAVGTPVVCLDAGGPAVMVDDHRFGTRVDPSGDVVEALAHALAGAPPPHEGVDRWSLDRIEALVDRAYVAAKAAHSGRGSESFYEFRIRSRAVVQKNDLSGRSARTAVRLVPANGWRGRLLQNAAAAASYTPGSRLFFRRRSGWPLPIGASQWEEALRALGIADVRSSVLHLPPGYQDQDHFGALLRIGPADRAVFVRAAGSGRAAYAGVPPSPKGGRLRWPDVVATASVGGWHFLATTAIPARAHRPTLLDLGALRRVCHTVANADWGPSGTRIGSDLVPMHGDLTPWNLRSIGRTRYLLDWDDAGLGPPGSDLVRYLSTAPHGRHLAAQLEHAEREQLAGAIAMWVDRVTGSMARDDLPDWAKEAHAQQMTLLHDLTCGRGVRR